MVVVPVGFMGACEIHGGAHHWPNGSASPSWIATC